jgi:hypothetical protein
MVIDELGLEDNKPCATFAELNRHLESALPEVYLKDIYKYLRDCEASFFLLSCSRSVRLNCIVL